MSFNPDHRKQAVKVFFSRKLKRPTHPPLKFNGTFLDQTRSQKYLVLMLHRKLNFEEHLQNSYKKRIKTVAVI